MGDGHLGDIAIDDVIMTPSCARSNNELPGHPTSTELPPVGECHPINY